MTGLGMILMGVSGLLLVFGTMFKCMNDGGKKKK